MAHLPHIFAFWWKTFFLLLHSHFCTLNARRWCFWLLGRAKSTYQAHAYPLHLLLYTFSVSSLKRMKNDALKTLRIPFFILPRAVWLGWERRHSNKITNGNISWEVEGEYEITHCYHSESSLRVKNRLFYYSIRYNKHKQISFRARWIERIEIPLGSCSDTFLEGLPEKESNQSLWICIFFRKMRGKSKQNISHEVDTIHDTQKLGEPGEIFTQRSTENRPPDFFSAIEWTWDMMWAYEVGIELWCHWCDENSQKNWSLCAINWIFL